MHYAKLKLLTIFSKIVGNLMFDIYTESKFGKESVFAEFNFANYCRLENS